MNFDNLWSGPGMPFGGSLIMMTLDIFLYALLAYYLDSVVPSEYGIKRPAWFCFTPGFWCKKKVQRVSSIECFLTNKFQFFRIRFTSNFVIHRFIGVICSCDQKNQKLNTKYCEIIGRKSFSLASINLLFFFCFDEK